MDQFTADKPCLRDEPPPPEGKILRRVALRWIALTGAVVSAAIAAWIWWGPATRHGITDEQIPLLLFGGVVGIAAAVIAALRLRASSRFARVGEILIGLSGVVTGGWSLFVAWMVAIFPKC